MERIGIVGLGRMGWALAERYHAQGVTVGGWTRSGVDPAAAAEIGLLTAQTLAALAADHDVLVLSLFDDAAVAAVLGDLSAMDLTAKLIVDTSTVSPTLLAGLEPGLNAAGACVVDAPISGGPEMVRDGTCSMFLGGADADVERAIAALTPVTERLFHIGPVGAGMGMKTANNSLLQGYFASLAEVLQIAKRSGIEFRTALDILAAGPGGAPVLTARMSKILGEDDGVGFPISGTLKDSGVFLGAATALGIETPVLQRARALMEGAAADGWADRDVAALLAWAWDAT